MSTVHAVENLERWTFLYWILPKLAWPLREKKTLPTAITKVYFVKVISIISFNALKNQTNLDVGQKLHSAFTTVGFAYMVNHGIPSQLMAESFELWRLFFEGHTMEEKEAAFPRNPVTTHGYVKPDLEQLDVPFKEEQGEPVHTLSFLHLNFILSSQGFLGCP